ncbi:flagellar brake protein [Halonatronum saccharophilum]|uniref:flagellar brake protein n=1 Tax=Halonatronum saccharophilum TaxID=150060 RepID=UPI000483930C|nr:flagellar brake domain-containing protein [Halonatronum saccharophilum]
MKRNFSKVRKFNVERRLEINQKVDIKYSFGEKEESYSSQVVDLLDEETFIVNAPFSEGLPVNLGYGSRVNIIVRDKNGLYDLPVKLINKKVDTTPLWVFKLIGEVNRVQEREFFRLDIYQEIEFKQVDSCDRTLDAIDDKEDIVNYKGIIKDISATGLQIFMQDRVLSEGEVIEIDFSSINVDLNRILGKVVRVSEVFNKDLKRYSLGVEFVHSNENDKDKLMEWLFAKQRELRRKGLL